MKFTPQRAYWNAAFALEHVLMASCAAGAAAADFIANLCAVAGPPAVNKVWLWAAPTGRCAWRWKSAPTGRRRRSISQAGSSGREGGDARVMRFEIRVRSEIQE